MMLLLSAAAACLLHGLFFARDMYGLLVVWFVLCAAVAVFLSFKEDPTGGGESEAEKPEVESGTGNSDGANPGRGSRGEGSSGSLPGTEPAVSLQVAGNRRNYIHIVFLSCPLLIVALYAVHLLRGPLSVQGTLNELLRWGLYGSFAFFAVFCAGRRGGARILALLWHVLGMTICLSGLLAVCGLPLPYAIAYTDSPAVSVTGARLGGLLQYPNAFGAVMAVFLLERIVAVAADGVAARARLRAPGTAGQLLRMLPLFPYAAALLLSESRGAMLAAACAAAAALLWKRQLAAPLLICAAAPAAAAALYCRQLARTGLAAEPLPGLLLLAGCWAGALLAGLWLYRRCRRAAGGHSAAMLMAAGLWTAAGSAVLALLRGRISGPSPTAAARGLFYRDAWRLAGEAPWLGQGGETWRSAYLAAQSRPYVGSQVHSGYLDFLLNLGITGSAVLLLMLLAAGILAGRNAPGLLPPLLVILLHGAVDFSWSYGLFWLLLFLLTARTLAASPQPKLVSREPDAGFPASRTGLRDPAALHGSVSVQASSSISVFRHLSAHLLNSGPSPIPATDSVTGLTSAPVSAPAAGRHKHINRHTSAQRAGVRIMRVILVAVVCSCLMLSGLSFKLWKGEVLFRQAVRSAEPEVQRMLLQKSLRYNPYAPRTALSLAVLLPEEEKIKLLHSSLEYSPDDAGLHWLLAESYLADRDPGRALYWVRRSLVLDKFNAVKWESAANGMLQMGQYFLTKGERQNAAVSALAGQGLLRSYRVLALEEHAKGPAHNDRDFKFSLEAEEAGVELNRLIAAAYEVKTVQGDEPASLKFTRE
ncbi:O-antigen ligase family protein [Paenibacillus sp. FSL R7-0345]|uniref:O-antigen ligase family protein n=1 Tax=Paenibacillus sp. FSL R7-0345 TaxID=2954535 RepID=UPI00315A3BC3